MKFSVKSMLVALAMLLGGTMVPAVGEAQTFQNGGLIGVRDGGQRVFNGRRDGRRSHSYRRDGRRGFYGERRQGSRYYRGSRHDRRGYYSGRRYGRDRFYSNRRHNRNGSGIVIRLR